VKILPIVLVALAAAGCVKQTPAPPAQPKPIAIIGLTQCGKWMGAIVVDSTGEVHGSTTITPEQSKKIADSLPPSNNMLAEGPCSDGANL
jgi:hypothetical protein